MNTPQTSIANVGNFLVHIIRSLAMSNSQEEKSHRYNKNNKNN